MPAIQNFTGRDVVLAAKADLTGFFLPNANFEVRTRDGIKHALKGSGSDAYVQFDTLMLGAPVNDLETFLFVMLVFGHEATHYLHRHNDQSQSQEETNLDARSMEIWADFYGTKMALTLVTFGRECMAIYGQLSGCLHKREHIRAMGSAIGRLGETYFAMPSDVHEDCVTRVGHCAAGVTSFFDGYYGDQNVKRSLEFMVLLYDNTAMKHLMSQAGDSYMTDTAPIDRIAHIHQQIQGTARAITEGMHPLAAWFLSTDYFVDPEIRRSIAESKQELLQRELAIIFGQFD